MQTTIIKWHLKLLQRHRKVKGALFVCQTWWLNESWSKPLKQSRWANMLMLGLQHQEIPERGTPLAIHRNGWKTSTWELRLSVTFFFCVCALWITKVQVRRIEPPNMLMMVEYFTPSLSVLSPISRQECPLLFSALRRLVLVFGYLHITDSTSI